MMEALIYPVLIIIGVLTFSWGMVGVVTYLERLRNRQIAAATKIKEIPDMSHVSNMSNVWDASLKDRPLVDMIVGLCKSDPEGWEFDERGIHDIYNWAEHKGCQVKLKWTRNEEKYDNYHGRRRGILAVTVINFGDLKAKDIAPVIEALEFAYAAQKRKLFMTEVAPRRVKEIKDAMDKLEAHQASKNTARLQSAKPDLYETLGLIPRIKAGPPKI